MLSISGTPEFLSHFVTACLETPSFSANFSCEIPDCFLSSFNFSAKVFLLPPFDNSIIDNLYLHYKQL